MSGVKLRDRRCLWRAGRLRRATALLEGAWNQFYSAWSDDWTWVRVMRSCQHNPS